MIDKNVINNIIKHSTSTLENNLLKQWFLTHLIEPTKISLDNSILTLHQNIFWLITDHIGINDSSYRIIHSLDKPYNFGLEMTNDLGKHGFLGFYGNLKETLENM